MGREGVCECVGGQNCLPTCFSHFTSSACGETSRARSLASLRIWEEEHAEFNPREKRSDTMGFGITSEIILSCRLDLSDIPTIPFRHSKVR